MKDVWAKLDGEFGLADKVALRLLDRFQAWKGSQKNENRSFVEVYDKFVELKQDLQEWKAESILSDVTHVRNVVRKMLELLQ